ncbi:50S ribosomal protein L22 [archaeon]|nr:50S ribosomal protein L22 [archaeon]
MRGYSTQIKGAKAYGSEINISRKHAVEVCTAIRGKRLEKAKQFLQDVTEKKQFVELHKHKKQVPHRTGGTPGRYPVKAAKEILKVLENAENNAENKDMEGDLIVKHAAAHYGRTYQRRAPKGKWKTSNIETTNIEIILTEA